MSPVILLIAVITAAAITLRYLYYNICGPWKNAPPGSATIDRYKVPIVVEANPSCTTHIGPFVLPFIGSVFDYATAMDSPLMLFHNLARKHGPIARLKLGEQNIVILSGTLNIVTSKEFLLLFTIVLLNGSPF